MAEHFGEISPVSENPQGCSTDTGLPIHQVDIQHPPTKETQGCHVHPAQDEGLVDVVVQDQDGCHSQLHPSDIPPLNPEESQDKAQPAKDGEDKLDQGLSGDPPQPGADQDPQRFQTDSSPRPLLVLHQHHEWTVRPDGGLCSDPESPGDPTPALPQGVPRPPSLAQVTAWKSTQSSDAGGYSMHAAGGSGGSPPALVITQAEESGRAVPLNQPPPVGEPQGPSRPADLPLPAGAYVPGEPSPGSSDVGDMVCSDLLSLRSDSLSMASDTATSGRSEEGPDDDTRSMASSSVMSLYHRVHLDPLEKDWLRSSALGNICAQRLLLTQDPTLAHKKTALHWAAKQGRLDTVDLMFLSGVDVNVRSGYTALHLASIHSHQHMVLALINTYNAKTDIRDYHGKKAVHYWSERSDAFNKPGAESGGNLTYGKRSQRYPLPGMLLSRSRSQGQPSLAFTTAPHSSRLHVLDIALGF
ncbi:unnamed protein product [Lota lota]